MAYEYVRRTDEEIKQLAIDTVNGKLFGSWQLEKGTALSPFLPLMLMNKEQLKELVDADVVHCFEYMDKASERSCNGVPMFMTMQMLTKEDAIRMFEEAHRYQLLQREFMQTKSETT